MTTPLPVERSLNPDLVGPGSEEIVLIDVLPIRSGDVFEVAFEQVHSEWRQGVWLGTEGCLEVNGVESSQFVLWQDTAPDKVQVRVLKSDGCLRLYNVWDSGRGLSDHESQSATSGMLVEEEPGGGRRYRCNDIGYESAFDKVRFTVRTV